MTDSKRLVVARAGEPAGELLKAARSVHPPPGAQARLLATLGSGTALVAASSAAASASAAPAAASAASAATIHSLTGGAVAKWMLLGAVIGAAATTGGTEVAAFIGSASSAESVAPGTNALPARALEPGPRPARPQSADSDPAPPPTDEYPRARAVSVTTNGRREPLPPPTVRSVAPAAPIGTAQFRSTAASPAVESSSALRAEVEALDAARAAVRAGDTPRALAHLTKVEGGRLSDEATLLRVQALMKAGDVARARQAARVFLTGHPGSPFASRIRAAAELDQKPSGVQ